MLQRMRSRLGSVESAENTEAAKAASSDSVAVDGDPTAAVDSVTPPLQPMEVPVAGSSVPQNLADPSSELQSVAHTWSLLSGSAFNVRTGPNYKRTGQKVPPAEPLYKMVGCDVFRANEAKKDRLAAKLRLMKPAVVSPIPEVPKRCFGVSVSMLAKN